MPARDEAIILTIAKRLAVLTISVLASLALSASACITVALENQSEAEITGFWGAFGCAGIYNAEDPVLLQICEHHKIGPGKRNSYDYEWLKSALTLWVTFKVDADFGEYNQMRRYIYEHGGFRHNTDGVPGTPFGCHGHYTVVFTQEDFLEEQNK